MRIECPTCEIGFNVSDEQIGQKGLCPKCETKFIIPAEPGGEIEVLAEGKLPADKKKESREKAPEARKREPETEPEAKPPTAEAASLTRELDDGYDVAGGAGKAIGLLAIGLIIGLVIGFAVGRMTAGSGTDAADAGTGAVGDTTDPFGLGEEESGN